MAKLAKKYIALAKKKVPSSQWRARGLKTAWGLQKKAQKGGGRAKPAAKPKGKPRGKSNPKGGNMTSKNPKIGASYMAAKRGDLMLSPLLDSVAINKTDLNAVQADLSNRDTGAYLGAVVTGAVDTAIDKKMQQSTAISHGSVTAIAPEVYLGSLAFEEMRGRGFSANGVRVANARYLRAAYGYDPQGVGGWNLNQPEHKTYRTIKHVGQAIRLARSKIKAVNKLTEPVSKALGMLGLRV